VLLDIVQIGFHVRDTGPDVLYQSHGGFLCDAAGVSNWRYAMLLNVRSHPLLADESCDKLLDPCTIYRLLLTFAAVTVPAKIRHPS